MINETANDVNLLLERIFMLLEDGDFERASKQCEHVLDIDPKCAEAHLGKLMAQLHVKKQEELAMCNEPFDNNNNFQRVLNFGGESLTKKISEYNDKIKERVGLLEKQEELNQLKKQKAKKRRKSLVKIILSIIALLLIGFIVVEALVPAIGYYSNFNEACELMEEQKFEEAMIKCSAASRWYDASFFNSLDIAPLSHAHSYTWFLSAICKTERQFILNDDGTVSAASVWEDYDLQEWKNIIDVRSVYNGVVGLKEDGTVVAQGDVDHYFSKTDHIQKFCNSDSGFMYGIKNDGTVVPIWTFKDYWQPQMAGWKDIKDVYYDGSCAIGLRQDGTIAVEYDEERAVENKLCAQIKEWTDIKQINILDDCVIGLKTDGTILATSNIVEYSSYIEERTTTRDKMSNWKNIEEIYVSNDYNDVIIGKSDNKIVECFVSGYDDSENFADKIKGQSNVHNIQKTEFVFVVVFGDGTIECLHDVSNYQEVYEHAKEFKVNLEGYNQS